MQDCKRKGFLELEVDKEYYIINKKNNCVLFLGKLLIFQKILSKKKSLITDNIEYERFILKFENIKDEKLEKYFSNVTYKNMHELFDEYDRFYEIVS
jgi:hypothetical protein